MSDGGFSVSPRSPEKSRFSINTLILWWKKTVCETCAGKKRKGEQRQRRRSLWVRKIFRWILAENFWFQVTVLVQIKLFQCPSTRLLVYKAFEILRESHVWTFPQFKSKAEAKTKTMSRDFGGSSEAKTKSGQTWGGKKKLFLINTC